LFLTNFSFGIFILRSLMIQSQRYGHVNVVPLVNYTNFQWSKT